MTTENRLKLPRDGFIKTRSMVKRPKIPDAIQTQLLLRNRHACCICQKPRVQIHHIDGDARNNDISNLAVLCLEHHDLATMQVGLIKKLRPMEVRDYKNAWEVQCRNDMLALARDRIAFYVTLYKNPPRIREQFAKLSAAERVSAVSLLRAAIHEEEGTKAKDAGYQWQRTTRADERTNACLISAAQGELWPSWLPRVGGHPLDPDYPTDLSPPNGMEAFHTFDLYCQVLVRVLLATSNPIPLEFLFRLSDERGFDSLSGQLVTFRERTKGKGVRSPRAWNESPTSIVTIRSKREPFICKVEMPLKTMYIFSDTAVLNLRNSRACGVGIFGGATHHAGKSGPEIRLRIVPLFIGLGGPGQSDASGWVWKEEKGKAWL